MRAMKDGFNSVARAGLLALGLILVPGQGAFAQTGAEPPQGPAEERTSREVLDSLLDRLAGSEDAATAQILERAILDGWMQSGSDTINLLMSRTVDAMQREDLPTALDFSNAMVELAPDFAEGWNKRATILYLLRDFKLSLSDVEKTLELEPRHFGALSGLGLIMLELGDKEGALLAFRKALAVHPFLENALKTVERLIPEVEGQEL